jgi:hypothetical protein
VKNNEVLIKTTKKEERGPVVVVALDAKVGGKVVFVPGKGFVLNLIGGFTVPPPLSKRRLAIVKRGFFLAFKIKLSPEDFIKASVVT